jgi:hypothetical protein
MMVMILTSSEKKRGNWARVSRRNPCPICGKGDWCMVSLTAKVAICARIESDKSVGTKGAGWLHRLDQNESLQTPTFVRNNTQTQKAVPAILDRVYAALLQELSLSSSHRDHLRQRGLTNTEIDLLGYRTIHSYRYEDIESRLPDTDLSGIPGFYLQDGKWRLATPPGIAIPIKDLNSRIIAIQVRCDNPSRGKYRWVSSAGFNQGCSSQAPIHVTGDVAKKTEVWITEGALKADIAALRIRKTFLAVPGVNNWSGIIPIIRQIMPQRVIVAFDMDKLANPAVKFQNELLVKCLLEKGIRTFEATWDQNYKGLDDLVVREK